MSQAKVDRYKEQKANRKQIMEKQKRQKMLWKAGSCVVALALVGWIGYSAYDKLYEPPRKFYELDSTAVDEYLNGLSVDDVVEDVVDTLEDTEETTETGTEISEETTEEETAVSEEATEEETEASEEATEETTEASEEATEEATEASEE